MAKIDLRAVEHRQGTDYPPPLDREVEGRSELLLSKAGGLSQFGANLVYLEPGAKSSMRHWHKNEDEFVMVTEGRLKLVMDGGETDMLPGDCAAFPAGVQDGHCLMNRSEERAGFLVIGTRARHEVVTYSDLDLMAENVGAETHLTHKDGTPWRGAK